MAEPVVEPAAPPVVDAQAATASADAARVAAETKATADAEAARVAAAAAVPDTYEFKLPDGVAADAPIVERTAAIARELGLSADGAQKLLDREVADTASRQAGFDEQVKAWSPGGTEFTKRETQWRAEALADADLGAGDPAKLVAAEEKGAQALAKYAPELIPMLKDTGYAAHPAVLKAFARIGKAMSEGAVVLGDVHRSAPKSGAQTLYSDHYNTDGSPKR